MQAREARIEVEVRYAETDQMGVVHHAVYPVWFELARTRLCAATGYPYADIERLGYRLLVTRLAVDYRRPARYGTSVEIRCRLDRFASRGLRFAYEVRHGDELLARGTSDHVWLEAADNRICRVPEVLRRPFERLVAAPSESRATTP